MIRLCPAFVLASLKREIDSRLTCYRIHTGNYTLYRLYQLIIYPGGEKFKDDCSNYFQFW